MLATVFPSGSWNSEWLDVETLVTTRRYRRDWGPRMIQFKMFGLNEVKINFGREETEGRLGRAPKTGDEKPLELTDLPFKE